MSAADRFAAVLGSRRGSARNNDPPEVTDLTVARELAAAVDAMMAAREDALDAATRALHFLAARHGVRIRVNRAHLGPETDDYELALVCIYRDDGELIGIIDARADGPRLLRPDR
jgi:hypothetical protein